MKVIIPPVNFNSSQNHYLNLLISIFIVTTSSPSSSHYHYHRDAYHYKQTSCYLEHTDAALQLLGKKWENNFGLDPSEQRATNTSASKNLLAVQNVRVGWLTSLQPLKASSITYANPMHSNQYSATHLSFP